MVRRCRNGMGEGDEGCWMGCEKKDGRDGIFPDSSAFSTIPLEQIWRVEGGGGKTGSGSFASCFGSWDGEE